MTYVVPVVLYLRYTRAFRSFQAASYVVDGVRPDIQKYKANLLNITSPCGPAELKSLCYATEIVYAPGSLSSHGVRGV